MILFIAIGLMLAAGLYVRFVSPAVRRHRMAAELRHDWWPQFEADLRNYATSWRSAREAERRR
jgi:hypothetical protein